VFLHFRRHYLPAKKKGRFKPITGKPYTGTSPNDLEESRRVLTGQGANIDTTTAGGRLVFGIFGALAEFERELIRERTIAGLSSARARGRNGGRPYTMTPAKLRLAQAAMTDRDTKVGDLCKEVSIPRQSRGL
jgi:Resolvase, N terminal domain